MKLEWEEIEQPGHAGYLWRASIFGGWLVKHVDDVHSPVDYGEMGISQEEGYEWKSSITFVPDLNHEWK